MDQRKSVTLQIDGPIAEIILSRPERANAMDRAFFSAFAEVFEALADSPEVRAVVLRGEGRHFCAGGDLHHPLFSENDAAVRREQVAEAFDVTRGLLDLPVPLVCAVQGRVAGAAHALLLSSDMRVAARSSVFSLDFVRLGLSPDMGVTWLLAPAIGTARAVEMAITGDLVDADTALSWGLVSRVVEDGDQVRVARELARRLAENPPAGMAAVRHLTRTLPWLPREQGFDLEIESMNNLIPSTDCQARLEGFRNRPRRSS